MTGAAPGRPARRWAGLLFIGLGVAMIIVDATIVNVAVPAIIAGLGITSADAQWVRDAYTLAFAALLLAAGRLADRFGRRRMFLAGVGVFVLASLVAATARSGGWLIAARLAQGVGGAAILPSSLSLLNATFRGRERAIAFAVWGSTIGGTAALGPLLGGWLTTSLSWRWAFGINLGIGAVVVPGVGWLVAESRGDTRPGGDWAGAALTVAGLGGIVFALIEGRTDGWWQRTGPVSLAGLSWRAGVSPVPVAAAIGVAAIVVFAVREARRARAGRVMLLDVSLFRITSSRNGNIAAAIVSLGGFGTLFAVPLWLQNARGLTAFDTGLVLLALATGSFAASGIVPRLAQAYGPLVSVRIGVGLELAGGAALGAVVTAHTAPAVLVGPLLVYGAGIGMATAQLTGVVLADVPVAQSGQGSATQPGGERVAAAARAALSDGTRLAAFTAAGFLALGLLATTRLHGTADGPAAGQNPGARHQSATERS